MNQQAGAEPLHGGTPRFEVVIRGYDRTQVDDALDSLGKQIAALRADREAQSRRAEQLTEQIASMRADQGAVGAQAQAAAAASSQAMGTRISQMLQLAEEEASDIRRSALEDQDRIRADIDSANRESEAMRTEARERLEGVAAEAQANAQVVADEARDRAATLVAEAQARVDHMILQAQGTVAQLEAQSESQVAKVTEELDLFVASRRAESARIEQERDQASRQEVHARLGQAQAEAEHLVAAAQRRVSELETQRLEVSRWLDHLRQALATVPEAPHTDWTPQPRAPEVAQAVPDVVEDPEAEAARGHDTVLGREDILEYRHMRRSLR